MLFRLNRLFGDGFVNFYIRQQTVFIIVVIIVAAFLIQFQKAVKSNYLTISSQQYFTVAGQRIYHHLIQNGRFHLTGYGSFPNQFIKLICIRIQFFFHFFRRIHYIRRANRLMCLLSVLGFGLVFFSRFREILFTEIF